MHIYLKNIPVNFHPNLIWNDGALGFFEDGYSSKNNNHSNDYDNNDNDNNNNNNSSDMRSVPEKMIIRIFCFENKS